VRRVVVVVVVLGEVRVKFVVVRCWVPAKLQNPATAEKQCANPGPPLA
jgi:hypothetical protein